MDTTFFSGKCFPCINVIPKLIQNTILYEILIPKTQLLFHHFSSTIGTNSNSLGHKCSNTGHTQQPLCSLGNIFNLYTQNYSIK